MAQVGYVVSLLSLGVGHNRLTSLPAEVALLTRLTWLGLDGNPLILPTARQPPLLALQPPPPSQRCYGHRRPAFHAALS